MLKPEATKIFSDFASKVFIPHIFSQFHKVSHVNLEWDRYIVDSLKASTRAKRGKVQRRVVAEAFQEIGRDFFLWRAIKLSFLSFCQRLYLCHLVKKINCWSSLMSLPAAKFGVTISMYPQRGTFSYVAPCKSHRTQWSSESYYTNSGYRCGIVCIRCTDVSFRICIWIWQTLLVLGSS